MKAIWLMIGTLVMGCTQQSEVTGKWYTYADSGDYMELWLGEDRALFL